MKKKKILITFMVIMLICMVGVLPSHAVSAAEAVSLASNDTIASASVINMGDTVKGSITETNDLDYYKFSLNSAGCITLDMTSYMTFYCIRIYDSDGKEIWYTDDNVWTETVGYRCDTYDVYLEKGIYYMQVNGYRWGTSYKSTGKYECCTEFLSSGVNNAESDNSFFDANYIALGKTIIGQISENDDFDTYSFSFSEDGCVTLNMASYMKYYCIRIYDSDGKEIWYTDDNAWTEAVGYRCDTYDIYLEKGTYYMQVNGYAWGTSYKSTGKYVAETKFVPSSVSFNVDNNSFALANAISWNVNYTGQISENDNYDTYKFDVPRDQTVVVNMTSYMKYYCIAIYDLNGKRIWYTDDNEWNNKVGYRKDANNVVLSAGTYYMQVNGYAWGTSYKSTGKYVFSLAELNQFNCDHEYTDTRVDATYFQEGYTLHKCEKCGKAYKDNYKSRKELGKGYISTYSYSGKGKLYLQWYTVYDASGYQIRYCTSNAMKKGVKTKTIKGQSKYKTTIKKLSRKKKYYIQIRAYKKSGSKIAYGKWSSKKCLKTK